MQEQGRRIALLIDNAPTHKDCETLRIESVKLIRLPPNTTSMAQPLDAVIVRPFKALYSNVMSEAVARVRTKSKLLNDLPSNAALWLCIARAWGSVTPTCIRCCFAEISILISEQRNRLHCLGIESREDQVFQLQEKLIKEYGEDEGEATKQKDIGVLNHLTMNYCEGSSESISDAVKTIMTSEKHKHRFITHTEDGIVYRGDEIENDDNFEYDLSHSGSGTQVTADPETCINDEFILQSLQLTTAERYRSINNL
ncbi:hypothetical protein BX616_008027 [Lobosporangium transversale]|nr:hypothetical protein BX616_008027 [Lobosporangium transversale]